MSYLSLREAYTNFEGYIPRYRENYREGIEYFEQQMNDNKIIKLDKIFVLYLNLLDRQDRNLSIQKELNSVGILKENILRIDAAKTKMGYDGCALSHITALSTIEKLLGKKDFKFMIIEDDLKFVNYNRANRILKMVNDGLISGFDMMLLACNPNPNKFSNFKKIGKSNILHHVLTCGTTTGYIINSGYVKKLKEYWLKDLAELSNLKYFKKTYKNMAIDQTWKNLQKQDNWVIVLPVIAIQASGFSDIAKLNLNYKPLMT